MHTNGRAPPRQLRPLLGLPIRLWARCSFSEALRVRLSRTRSRLHSNSETCRILWATWHLASAFGFGFAAILLILAKS